MKRTFPLPVVFLCIAPAALVAQLPYTASNAVPGHISRSYEIHETFDVVVEGLPTSGYQQVWDVSAYVVDEPFNETWYFEPASATPYAYSYPSSNLVAWYVNPSGSSEYLYMMNSQFELRLLGGVVASESEVYFHDFCPDPYLLMEYPMNMGSGVQHNYNCPENDGEVDVWTIVATGDIIFADVVLEDVVMWRSVFTSDGVDYTSYFWTQPDNMLYPVMRYFPGYKLSFRKPTGETQLGVGIGEVETSHFSLFPNPATDRLVIRLDADVPAGNASILLYDALGKISSRSALTMTGGADHSISLAGLAPGIYALELRDAQRRTHPRRLFVKE